MKINVVLLGFILITFSVFKAAIIPNEATHSIENSLIPPTVDFAGLSESFNKVGDCSGFTSCIEAFSSAAVKLFYFIGQLFIAIFYILVDIFLLITLFITIGLSPIPTAPVIVNIIVIGIFFIMSLIAIISLFSGD